MKAISIRQPWAWLIINGGKDIENRTWATKLRRRVLVHAAKGLTRKEYEAAIDFIVEQGIPPLPFELPAFEQLERGGIIGSVLIEGCVESDQSRWFTGPYGFVLGEPEPMPFIPLKGRLGFFEVNESLLNSSVEPLVQE